jgi:hypothetical protein
MAVSGARSSWYHQPVFWLGALILAATLAGCIQLIVLATRHADEPLATGQPVIFRIPTAQPAASGYPHDPSGEAPP